MRRYHVGWLGAGFRGSPAVSLTLLVGLVACGGGSGVTTTPSGGSIALSLGAASGSVAAGGTTHVSASIIRGGGFTGTVTITVDGVPSGVSGAVLSTQTVGTTTTAAIEITAQAGAAAGSYDLTVRASGTGVTDASAVFTLTITPAATATIGLTAGPVTVTQGSSGTVGIAVARSNFSLPVVLTAENLPTGVTLTFAPATVTGTSSTATVSVAASVAVGSYTLTVRGTSTGVADATTTIPLTVIAAPSFTIAAAPTGVPVMQGGNGTSTITIAPLGGFSSAVSFSASGLPSGATAAFAPPTAATSTTLTLTVGAAVTPGAYPVTVTGTAGTLAAQATVTLTVSAATPAMATFDFSQCVPGSASSPPVFFAAQDGNQPWAAITPVNNVYRFPITAATGAYAYEIQFAATGWTVVGYRSRAELTATPQTFCTGLATATKAVFATIAGLQGSDAAAFYYGGVTSQPFPTAGHPNVSFFPVLDGSFDVFGSVKVTGPPSTVRVFLLRNQDPPDGGSLGTLDLGGANAFDAIMATMSITNLAGGERADAYSNYLTGSACNGGGISSVSNAGSSFALWGVPAAQQQPGDFHRLTIDATAATSFRSQTLSTHAFAPHAFTLPPLPTGVSVSSAGSAYQRMQVMLDMPTGFTNPSVTFNYQDRNTGVAAYVGATAAALSGPIFSFGMPDLSALPGWNNSYAATVGSPLDWQLSVSDLNYSGNACSEGAMSRTAQVSGSH